MSSTEIKDGGDDTILSTTTITPTRKDSSVTDEEDAGSDGTTTDPKPKKSRSFKIFSKSNEEDNTNKASLKSRENEEPAESQRPSCSSQFWKIYTQYEFLILIVIGICVAKAYPPLGAEYVHPEITANWVAVMFIFCKYCSANLVQKIIALSLFGFRM
jgi:hypothetical protein